MSEYRVFSGPCFPIYGLNMEIYGVNLRIQSKYGKIRTRKNSVLEHFLRSDIFELLLAEIKPCQVVPYCMWKHYICISHLSRLSRFKHYVKYRNFTWFPSVEILWKGTVCA